LQRFTDRPVVIGLWACCASSNSRRSSGVADGCYTFYPSAKLDAYLYAQPPAAQSYPHPNTYADQFTHFQPGGYLQDIFRGQQSYAEQRRVNGLFE
jgi:hypothetical protein